MIIFEEKKCIANTFAHSADKEGFFSDTWVKVGRLLLAGTTLLQGMWAVLAKISHAFALEKQLQLALYALLWTMICRNIWVMVSHFNQLHCTSYALFEYVQNLFKMSVVVCCWKIYLVIVAPLLTVNYVHRNWVTFANCKESKGFYWKKGGYAKGK